MISTSFRIARACNSWTNLFTSVSNIKNELLSLKCPLHECSLTCCWSDGDDGRAVGHHRRRVACYTRQRRRHRERVLGGPREVPSSHPRPRRQVTGSCSPPSSPTGLYARRKRLDPNHKSHFCPRRGEMARPAVLSKRRSTWSRGSGACSFDFSLLRPPAPAWV